MVNSNDYFLILKDLISALDNYHEGSKTLLSHSNLPIKQIIAYRAIVLSEGLEDTPLKGFNVIHSAQFNQDQLLENGRSWSLTENGAISYAKNYSHSESYLILVKANIEGFLLNEYSQYILSKFYNSEIVYSNREEEWNAKTLVSKLKRYSDDYKNEEEIVSTKVSDFEIVFRGTIGKY